MLNNIDGLAWGISGIHRDSTVSGLTVGGCRTRTVLAAFSTTQGKARAVGVAMP
ncbi:MAG: hypothetical protein ABI120_04480 [Gemmatimonadaceae bacterium]